MPHGFPIVQCKSQLVHRHQPCAPVERWTSHIGFFAMFLRVLQLHHLGRRHELGSFPVPHLFGGKKAGRGMPTWIRLLGFGQPDQFREKIWMLDFMKRGFWHLCSVGLTYAAFDMCGTVCGQLGASVDLSQATLVKGISQSMPGGVLLPLFNPGLYAQLMETATFVRKA